MTLSGLERRWLLCVFDTVVPSGATPRLPIGAKDAPMERFIDDLFARAPLHFLLGLRACLWILAFAPLFVIGRARTFEALEPELRLEVLDRLSRSERYVLRELPLLFKTTACLGFCGLSEVQSKVGIFPVDATAPDWARSALPSPGADA
jgi:hypothetical protein